MHGGRYGENDPEEGKMGVPGSETGQGSPRYPGWWMTKVWALFLLFFFTFTGV